MTLDFLKASIGADMARVDAVLRESLSSEVVLIRQIAEYIVASGGKRLRPALVLLAAKACGDPEGHRHTLAAVVEMIHTATLLHDDVVDESTQRRGRATANATFGNAASVLVGDFLYSRAFQMMVATGRMRVLEILSDATNVIAEGEVLQLMHAGDATLDEDGYVDVIRRKTAKLFEASARLGPVLAGAPAAIEEALAGYGMHLGTAFQLVDDVLDYSGDADTIGKSLGDDLAEGKPTLPLIRVLRAGGDAERDVVRRAIVDGGRDDFPAVIAAIRATGALDYARAAAQREAQAAIAALSPIPDSSAKQSLLELASFSVTRDH